jgi:hypothetical protein
MEPLIHSKTPVVHGCTTITQTRKGLSNEEKRKSHFSIFVL